MKAPEGLAFPSTYRRSCSRRPPLLKSERMGKTLFRMVCKMTIEKTSSEQGMTQLAWMESWAMYFHSVRRVWPRVEPALSNMPESCNESRERKPDRYTVLGTIGNIMQRIEVAISCHKQNTRSYISHLWVVHVCPYWRVHTTTKWSRGEPKSYTKCGYDWFGGEGAESGYINRWLRLSVVD